MEDLEPTEFLENHRDFFKNFSFKFEGLPSNFKKIYEIVVKDLGASVSNDAKYIFTDFANFELDKNKNRTDLYDIRFILDSLEAEKVLNIEQYNFSLQNRLHASSNDENKTDKDNVNISNNQDGTANDENKHRQTTKHIVINVFYKTTENIQSENTQNLKESDCYQNVNVDNEDYCAVIKAEQIPNYKTDNKLQTSNVQSNSKVAKYQNLIIKNKDKATTLKNNDIQMEDYPNNRMNIEEDSNNNLSGTETNDSDSTLEDIGPGPSTSKNNYDNSRKRTKITSGWIDSKKVRTSSLSRNIKNNVQKNKRRLTLSSSDSDMSVFSEQEENENINSDCWWSKQKKPLSESEICTMQDCPFEPGPHQKHYYPGRTISEGEKKILLRYLIVNKCINKAKGLKLWIDMINKGYLTHRTPESLRNCLRRTILPHITKYNLPQKILDQFLILEEKGARR